MKVFISWSGSLSHQIAVALREWLPSVIQAVRPYVSSQDIDKGARWSSDIAKELEASTFGVICVTPDNLESPWIHFEAGALSRSIDKSHVSPLLFEVKRSEVQGPLLQFQSTVIERDDVLKLVNSINSRLDEKDRLRGEQVEKAFEVWWPQLEKQLRGIKVDSEVPTARQKSDKVQGGPILEELLELARQQQRLIASPERLLPVEYLEFALRRVRHDPVSRKRASTQMHATIIELEESMARLCARYPEALDASELLGKLHRMAHDDEGAFPFDGERERLRRRRLGLDPDTK